MSYLALKHLHLTCAVLTALSFIARGLLLAYHDIGDGGLLATVAEKYPDRYADITKGIADIGRKATYLQGETLTLEDMRPTFDRAPVLAKMDVEIDKARKQAKTDRKQGPGFRLWDRDDGEPEDRSVGRIDCFLAVYA